MRSRTLLAALCLLPLALQEIDPTTGLPSHGPAESVPLPQVEGDGARVLWDLTHGVEFDYKPTGYYSQLVALLAADGFQVEATRVGLQNVDLSSYDIVVVAVGSSYFGTYTAGEVQVLKDFVLDGGGVLVMGDNVETPKGIQPVARGFGAAVNLSLIEPFDLVFTDFVDHPIFEGIDELYFRAAGEVDAFRGTDLVAFTDVGEPVIAIVENRPVIILGDGNAFTNTYIANADNVAFAHNVFAFLAL